MEELINHLNNRFIVNLQTGLIVRRDNGRICNTLDSYGYIQVCCGKFNGKRKMMKGHQIIFLIYYGYLPESSIDHKDRNKVNNSIANLLDSNPVMQGRNKPTSGVTYRSSTKTYRARIRANGFQFEKSFKDKADALSWRQLKELELWKVE